MCTRKISHNFHRNHIVNDSSKLLSHIFQRDCMNLRHCCSCIKMITYWWQLPLSCFNFRNTCTQNNFLIEYKINHLTGDDWVEVSISFLISLNFLHERFIATQILTVNIIGVQVHGEFFHRIWDHLLTSHPEDSNSFCAES